MAKKNDSKFIKDVKSIIKFLEEDGLKDSYIVQTYSPNGLGFRYSDVSKYGVTPYTLSKLMNMGLLTKIFETNTVKYFTADIEQLKALVNKNQSVEMSPKFDKKPLTDEEKQKYADLTFDDVFRPDTFGIDLDENLAKLIALSLMAYPYDYENMRTRIHLLFYGPPGSGKTRMLRNIVKVSGGIYVSHRVTSPALTVNLSDNTPGLLYYVNKNIISIDDIDKINRENIEGLLEAMEDGIVTAASSKGYVKYEARVIVLAATNAIKKVPEPILDRFDFTLHIPRPDREKVIDILLDKITSKKTNIGEIIRYKLYLDDKGYAPKITPKIRNNLVEISKIFPEEDSVRHIESIIRLVMARARAMKEVEVNEEHTEYVHKLLEATKKYIKIVDTKT